MGFQEKRKARRIRAAVVVSLFLITFAALFFAVRSQQVKAKELEAQEQAVLDEIEAEKQRQMEAKADREYRLSDEYQEREARRHFNLVNPGDFLILIIEK